MVIALLALTAAQAGETRPVPALQDTGPTVALVSPALEAPGGQAASAWTLGGPTDTALAASGAWTPTRRLRLHATALATSTPSWDATDLTFGATVGLLQGSPLDLALVPELTWVPHFGNVQSFAGSLTVAAGGRTPALGWTVNVTGIADTGQDLAIAGGAGFRARLFRSAWLVTEARGSWGLLGGPLGLGPVEGDLGLAVRASERAAALGFVRLTVDPDTLAWAWTAGVGIRARRTGLPPDLDRDHVSNRTDACTRTPEDVDGNRDLDGCPELDDDGDGLPDTVDQCPTEAEDVDGHQDADGCPDPDNDLDGVPEPEDACPDVAGRPEQGGCPDGDGDTVVDAQDECPARKGSPEAAGCPDWDGDGVPDQRDRCPQDPVSLGAVTGVSDGCPATLGLHGAEIRGATATWFTPGGEGLTEHGLAGLGELATLLRAHPAVHLVIRSDGSALGEARAAGVRGWLLGAASLSPGRISVDTDLPNPVPWATDLADLLLLRIPGERD